MKKISIIVAIASNWAIGRNNELLWHISDDLKRFKRITHSQYVIMGKKTLKSLPGGPLKNRMNIVITDVPGEVFPDCITVYSIEEAIERCHISQENFVIGGGMVYKQFMKHATKLYLTRIHKDFEADIFFPEIDFNQWHLTSSELMTKDRQNDFDYSYEIYEKISG